MAWALAKMQRVRQYAAQGGHEIELLVGLPPDLETLALRFVAMHELFGISQVSGTLCGFISRARIAPRGESLRAIRSVNEVHVVAATKGPQRARSIWAWRTW
jgi:hypothetical protein